MTKPKIKVVNAEWELVHEYYLHFKCPYCGTNVEDCNLKGVTECDKINRQFPCPHCKKKFKLKVPGE
jgi:predicted RNA-binding Zn-ribbon protein involved in translation (DUF1610 family)